jgi:hypothetical protein
MLISMKSALTLLSFALLVSLAYGASELAEVVCVPPAVAQAWS